MEFDLTKETDVVALMFSSKNEAEWNSNCDKVKEKNRGNYPSFWYSAIILSGVAHLTSANFTKK